LVPRAGPSASASTDICVARQLTNEADGFFLFHFEMNEETFQHVKVFLRGFSDTHAEKLVH
jgi:hypothetical protein